MLTNEEVRQEIIKALCKLANVDCTTKDKGKITVNSKNVHEAYDLLDRLKNKL
jgi:nitrate reductase NapAB chaperone NapD